MFLRMRSVSIVFVALLLHTSAPQASTVSNVCERVVRRVTATVSATVQFAFYPVAAPIRLYQSAITQGKEKPWIEFWKFPFQFLKKDKWFLSGFLLVAGATERSYTSGLEYLSATQELVPTDPDEPIVLVDAFSDDIDIARMSVSYLQTSGYPGHTNVHVIHPYSREGLIEQLKLIRARGKPIALMDYVSHANPGSLALGDQSIDFSGLEPLQDVFRPGAAIRIFGCRAAAGCQGPETIAAAGAFFLDQGGTVTASAKYVATGPVDLLGVGAQYAGLAPSVLPTWMTLASKWIQSPYMVPYAAAKGVFSGGQSAAQLIWDGVWTDSVLEFKIPSHI